MHPEGIQAIIRPPPTNKLASQAAHPVELAGGRCAAGGPEGRKAQEGLLQLLQLGGHLSGQGIQQLGRGDLQAGGRGRR